LARTSFLTFSFFFSSQHAPLTLQPPPGPPYIAGRRQFSSSVSPQTASPLCPSCPTPRTIVLPLPRDSPFFLLFLPFRTPFYHSTSGRLPRGPSISRRSCLFRCVSNFHSSFDFVFMMESRVNERVKFFFPLGPLIRRSMMPPNQTFLCNRSVPKRSDFFLHIFLFVFLLSGSVGKKDFFILGGNGTFFFLRPFQTPRTPLTLDGFPFLSNYPQFHLRGGLFKHI